MQIKDVISAIQSKELSIKQLADQYKVSDRTIQTKIKKLGYKWNHKEMMYEFTGEDRAVLEQDFDSLMTSPQPSTSRSSNKSTSNSTRKATSRTTSTSRSKSSKASTSDASALNEIASSVESPEAVSEDSPDIIDLLLSGKSLNSQRVYRGFYFDKDVLDIVDQAGNKSELINQALRKVFKDKGLL